MASQVPEDRYKDRESVNVNDADEMAYWAKKFGVSVLAIRAAVAKAGPLVRDVACELWKAV
jgi:Zn-dependent peptidase ImmA (M78 family)